MPQPLRTYLFDLDGTLIDSVELIMNTFRHTIMTHRGEAPPRDVWLKGLGTPLWDQLHSFVDDQDEVQARIATYREYNMANHDTMVRQYARVLEVIRSLKAAGHQLGVVTRKIL